MRDGDGTSAVRTPGSCPRRTDGQTGVMRTDGLTQASAGTDQTVQGIPGRPEKDRGDMDRWVQPRPLPGWTRRPHTTRSKLVGFGERRTFVLKVRRGESRTRAGRAAPDLCTKGQARPISAWPKHRPVSMVLCSQFWDTRQSASLD